MSDSVHDRRHRARIVTATVAGGLLIGIVVVFVLASIADDSTVSGSNSGTIFDHPALISRSQYTALSDGAALSTVQRQLGSAGIPAYALTAAQRARFEPAPRRSTCLYWTLRGQRGALVRLCFGSGGQQPLTDHELRR